MVFSIPGSKTSLVYVRTSINRLVHLNNLVKVLGLMISVYVLLKIKKSAS